MVKYSWNNIVKHIAYEQTSDRSVLLSANGKERRIDYTGERNNGTTFRAELSNNGTSKGTENSAQQSNSCVGEIKGNGVVGLLVDETERTPFNLELNEDIARKKSKRKKKKKGPNL